LKSAAAHIFIMSRKSLLTKQIKHIIIEEISNKFREGESHMGQKMVDIYHLIGKENGMRGQMRLAMLTGIMTADAKNLPDTPDKLAQLAAAYKKITKKECPVDIL